MKVSKGSSRKYADDVFVGQIAYDYTGNRIEHVADYFPYGKILREFVESDNECFLTTQHERDAETGLDYRGARYYDADIARFLSLDPHAANYPSLSDYSYVAGNPVIFIDPDGKDIIITNSYISTETGERKYFSVTYRDGLLYKDGKEYTPQEGGYIEQVRDELIELETVHHRLQSIINRLENSEETHEITNYMRKTRGGGDRERPDTRYVGVTGNFTPSTYPGDRKSSITQYFGEDMPTDGVPGPSIVVLAHELTHAYDRNTDNYAWFREERAGNTKTEIHAVKVENLVREYLGIPIRRSYHGVPIPELNK